MPKPTPARAALLAWAAYIACARLVLLATVSRVWPLPLPSALASGAGLLSVLGLLCVAGASTMRSPARRSGRRADRLVTSGAYRLGRHPQLVGWTSVLLAGPYLVGLAFVIPAEERKLLELYGAEYRNYQRRTPRFFGWPKR